MSKIKEKLSKIEPEFQHYFLKLLLSIIFRKILSKYDSYHESHCFTVNDSTYWVYFESENNKYIESISKDLVEYVKSRSELYSLLKDHTVFIWDYQFESKCFKVSLDKSIVEKAHKNDIHNCIDEDILTILFKKYWADNMLKLCGELEKMI